MYVLPVISANSSLAHDGIYIDKTGGKIILYDMPANTAINRLKAAFCSTSRLMACKTSVTQQRMFDKKIANRWS